MENKLEIIDSDRFEEELNKENKENSVDTDKLIDNELNEPPMTFNPNLYDRNKVINEENECYVESKGEENYINPIYLPSFSSLLSNLHSDFLSLSSFYSKISVSISEYKKLVWQQICGIEEKISKIEEKIRGHFKEFRESLGEMKRDLLDDERDFWRKRENKKDMDIGDLDNDMEEMRRSLEVMEVNHNEFHKNNTLINLNTTNNNKLIPEKDSTLIKELNLLNEKCRQYEIIIEESKNLIEELNKKNYLLTKKLIKYKQLIEIKNT